MREENYIKDILCINNKRFLKKKNNNIILDNINFKKINYFVIYFFM